MTTNIPKTLLTPTAYMDSENKHFNLWWQATFFMLSLFVVTLLLWGIDSRQLEGVSVWSKPLKFELSLAMYFVTLAWLAGCLPIKTQTQAGWRWASRFSVTAGVWEMLYILLQACRGRASHYNNATPIEAIMYALMGVGALMLVFVSFYLGWLLYRDYLKGKQDNFKFAAAIGLMLGSALTLLTASVMSSGQTHFVGTPIADSWTVPLLGWSLSGGDLRGPHFLATHLMQLLPLYGWWLHSQTVDAAASRQKILTFSGIYCAAVLAWFAVSFIL